MRFICSTIGSSGDVHPLLGLALALKERGHEVEFIVNPYFRQAVERFGLECIDLGTREQFLAATASPDLWKPMRSFRHIWESGLAPALRPQYEAFAARFRSGETVGIGNTLSFGARIAQENLGMPLVTVHLQPSVIWSRFDPARLAGVFGPRWLRRLQYSVGERLFLNRTVCPGLDAFRAELGLPPMRNPTRWWHSPWCVLCLFPSWYAAAQRDWPPHTFQTDFPLWDERTDAPLPAAVEQFLNAGDPPVVFTPGSANERAAGFFRAAVHACRTARRRGILLTRFPGQVPANLPAEVVHFDYVPFSQLLDRAAALVHPGGIGSMAQALAAGIPQLIVPMVNDQFDNGARLKRLGAGDVLKRSRFRGPAIAAKLEALLSSRAVATACHDSAAKLAARDGLSRAAVEVERFAEQRLRAPAAV